MYLYIQIIQICVNVFKYECITMIGGLDIKTAIGSRGTCPTRLQGRGRRVCKTCAGFPGNRCYLVAASF